MHIDDILILVSQIVSAILLLAGLLAFAFRTYISEWIKNRFKAEFDRQSESHKHSLLRELEAFKGALVHDLEEHKLQIDLRKNLATQIANNRLLAYQKIFEEFGVVIRSIYTYVILEDKYREPIADFRLKTLKVIETAHKTVDTYDFFLDPITVGGDLATIYKSAIYFVATDLKDQKQAEKLITDLSELKVRMRRELTA